MPAGAATAMLKRIPKARCCCYVAGECFLLTTALIICLIVILVRTIRIKMTGISVELIIIIILGRHGSASLCRVERENKMAATYNVKKLKRFLSKSKGCRVVKSTTGPQCNLTRNKHGMVTRLTC